MRTNHIDKHDDGLRQVMQRMKDARETPRLSADFEDKVMAQIEAIAPPRKAAKPSDTTRKVVKMWMLRAVSAAAVIAAIIFTVEALMTDGKDEKQMMAKTQPQKPVKPIIAQEEPTIAETEEKPIASSPRPAKRIISQRMDDFKQQYESTAPNTANTLPEEEEMLDLQTDAYLAMQDIPQRMNNFRKQHETNLNTETPYEDLY